MSIEKVRSYFKNFNIEDRVIEFAHLVLQLS